MSDENAWPKLYDDDIALFESLLDAATCSRAGGSKYRKRVGGVPPDQNSFKCLFLSLLSRRGIKVSPSGERTPVELFGEIPHDLDEDTVFAALKLVVQNVAGSVVLMRELNKTIQENIVEQHRPNQPTYGDLHNISLLLINRKLLVTKINKIVSLLQKYSKLSVVVFWGKVRIHHDGIFVFQCGKLNNTHLPALFNHYIAGTGGELILSPSDNHDRTKQYKDIFKQFNDTIPHDPVVEFKYTAPGTGFLLKLKSNVQNKFKKYYYSKLKKSIEFINTSIEQEPKHERLKERADYFATIPPLPPLPTPLPTPSPTPSPTGEIEADIPYVNVQLTSGADRKQYQPTYTLTGPQILLINQKVQTLEIPDFPIKSLTTLLSRYAAYTNDKSLAFLETIKSQEDINKVKYELQSFIEDYKSTERQNLPIGGGLLPYRKTAERFMHKGKSRIIWKKSTRKNAASFIKINNKYVNIKTCETNK